MGLPPITYAGAVALALMLALGFASVVKARLLAHVLGAPVNSLRWALVWATAGAAVLGWGATQLPNGPSCWSASFILGIYAVADLDARFRPRRSGAVQEASRPGGTRSA